MAATPPREKIDFRTTRSPFDAPSATWNAAQFSTLRMNPTHYRKDSETVGSFYRKADVTPLSRVDGSMIRAPMPSAYYLRARPTTADDARPSVSPKAPAAFPRLGAGTKGTIMRSPGVAWASSLNAGLD